VILSNTLQNFSLLYITTLLAQECQVLLTMVRYSKKSRSKRVPRGLLLNGGIDRVVTVPGKSIWSFTSAAATGAQNLSPTTATLFGPRLTALSAGFIDYRFIRLEMKIRPSLGGTYSILALGYDKSFPTTFTGTSLADVVNLSSSKTLSNSQTTPEIWILDRKQLTSLQPWYKVQSGTANSSTVQGVLLVADTVVAAQFYVEIAYIIQFRGACAPDEQ